MQEDSESTIDLGPHLARELDEVLKIFRAKEPTTEWTPERHLITGFTSCMVAGTGLAGRIF